MSVVYSIFQQTILLTIPLMIVALGDISPRRSNTINIALEGITIMRAFADILFLNMIGSRTGGQMQLLLAVLTSTTTGAVFAFFHAHASTNMKVNQTISGIAFNVFAPAFIISVTGVIQEVQQIQFNNTFRIESAPPLDSIPFFGPLLFQNTYITMYLGVATLILSVLVLYRTRLGLRLRSHGKHPQTADAVGTNVCRMQYAGVLTSGVLGGLGGLVFVIPIPINFSADVAGYGFLTLAVLIFEQWKPVKIIWTSLFPGLMKVVAAAYSGILFLAATGIPSCVYGIISYVAISIVLIFTSRNPQVSRAFGILYDKGQR